MVARLLKERGWDVEVFLYGDPDRLPPDARVNYERWEELGETQPWSHPVEPSGHGTTIVLDALFGTGLTRPIADKQLRYTLLDLVDCFDAGHGIPILERTRFGPAVVAVDIPSGISSDSGECLMAEDYEGLPGKLEAACAVADLTVTFHAMKRGHVRGNASGRCGKIVVKDIGL